ncbi:MAG: hypothetical protein HY554_09485 [Elusimicrobia bacterium]|nr:hypothetical protein [Elusimicrobiota bacterium]
MTNELKARPLCAGDLSPGRAVRPAAARKHGRQAKAARSAPASPGPGRWLAFAAGALAACPACAFASKACLLGAPALLKLAFLGPFVTR